MIKMYGIPNCNTIKKAKDALTAQGVDFEFHNYKKEGIDTATLESWCNQVGWKTLLNQRGTTWRKLSAEDKADINQSKAIALMCVYPSMIKRPVLVVDDKIIVGFDEAVYAEL
jgi:Spx/MgsR family transcriptional regulator